MYKFREYVQVLFIKVNINNNKIIINHVDFEKITYETLIFKNVNVRHSHHHYENTSLAALKSATAASHKSWTNGNGKNYFFLYLYKWMTDWLTLFEWKNKNIYTHTQRGVLSVNVSVNSCVAFVRGYNLLLVAAKVPIYNLPPPGCCTCSEEKLKTYTRSLFLFWRFDRILW